MAHHGGFLLLVHRQQKDADTGRAVLRFFDWGYRNGAAAAKELATSPCRPPWWTRSRRLGKRI